jgi:hypothetical protein
MSVRDEHRNAPDMMLIEVIDEQGFATELLRSEENRTKFPDYEAFSCPPQSSSY